MSHFPPQLLRSLILCNLHDFPEVQILQASLLLILSPLSPQNHTVGTGSAWFTQLLSLLGQPIIFSAFVQVMISA